MPPNTRRTSATRSRSTAARLVRKPEKYPPSELHRNQEPIRNEANCLGASALTAESPIGRMLSSPNVRITIASMIHHAEAGVPLAAIPRATQASSAEDAIAKHSAMTILTGMDGFRPASASRAHIQVKTPASVMTASEFGALGPVRVFPLTPYAITNPVWVTRGAGPFLPSGVVPAARQNLPQNDPQFQVGVIGASRLEQQVRAYSLATERLEGQRRVPLFYPRADDPADVRKVVLEEPPGNRPLTDEMVSSARKRLFGSWEMNWMAYNYAHDVALPGSTKQPVVYFMYPQAETADGRVDPFDPDNFKYEITVREG